MENFKELRECFINKYKTLHSLNEEIAEIDFSNMYEELLSNSESEWFSYFNLSDLRCQIHEITEAIDMEIEEMILQDYSSDPIERDYLLPSQLI